MYWDAPEVRATAKCRSCLGSELDWITKHISMAVPVPYPLSGEMAVVVCRDCGFVGNISPSTNQDYSNYYITNNKHHHRNEKLSEIDESYFRELIDLIESECEIVWSQSDVLDWGSGALLFSKLVQERGARSAHNYDMANPYPDLPYNVISSTHCIEHVLDFNAEFELIHSVLKENGIFLVALPDLRGYHEVYWGPYSAFDLEHINHFDIKALSEALMRAGFEIISTRESQRLVTPTLAYPEILVICRKSAVQNGEILPRSIREEPNLVLEKYIARAEADLSLMVAAYEQTISDFKERGQPVSVGIYGVASYAFRLIQVLNDRKGTELDWIADSDSRLTGRSIAHCTIKDLNIFAEWVENCRARGVRCLAFIAAVNAPRIEQFLSERFGPDLDICVLPPSCQNFPAK